ncbi:hypothetical protein D3Z36_03235 [Lachnospiraceae bacterium]|nr:hypothetical protein [Lachnospiraceae bacterium]
MEKKGTFFERNDADASKRLAKILLYMTLIFPVLFLCTAVGAFQIRFSDLWVITGIGCVCTIGPTVLQKMGVPVYIMKYISVIAVGIVVMIMGGNSGIGIYMTYGLAMLFSCMFFDKKFTLRISIIAYFMLVASLFLRSRTVQQIEYDTNMKWFITRTMGFTIEHIAMSAVFISIASGARKLLENLQSTENIKKMFTVCGQASSNLVETVDRLAQNMEESGEVNDRIVQSADRTLEDCAKSIDHIVSMRGFVADMVRASEEISHNSNEMLRISDDTYAQLQNYVKIMENAAEGMQEIMQTAGQTSEQITRLEEQMSDISKFADTIADITSQTNLLSLNASIEAARAGKEGRGFAVVAAEVGKLAESSEASSKAVVTTIKNVLEVLNGVKSANENNLRFVSEGIKQISAAKDEAVVIGEMQYHSKEKTEIIAANSEQLKIRSRTIDEMSGQMDEMLKTTKNRADSIVMETGKQRSITNQTSDTFQTVENTAKELLEISGNAPID